MLNFETGISDAAAGDSLLEVAILSSLSFLLRGGVSTNFANAAILTTLAIFGFGEPLRACTDVVSETSEEKPLGHVRLRSFVV